VVARLQTTWWAMWWNCCRFCGGFGGEVNWRGFEGDASCFERRVNGSPAVDPPFVHLTRVRDSHASWLGRKLRPIKNICNWPQSAASRNFGILHPLHSVFNIVLYILKKSTMVFFFCSSRIRLLILAGYSKSQLWQHKDASLCTSQCSRLVQPPLLALQLTGGTRACSRVVAVPKYGRFLCCPATLPHGAKIRWRHEAFCEETWLVYTSPFNGGALVPITLTLPLTLTARQ
jgi:hypothetical protein